MPNLLKDIGALMLKDIMLKRLLLMLQVSPGGPQKVFESRYVKRMSLCKKPVIMLKKFEVGGVPRAGKSRLTRGYGEVKAEFLPRNGTKMTKTKEKHNM